MTALRRRARIIHTYPPLWDGVCAISTHAVERALYRASATLHDMGVDHGSIQTLMSEQILNRSYVIPIFQQMCGKAVSEGMTTKVLANASHDSGFCHCFLHA